VADSTPRSLTYLPDSAVPFEPIVPQVSSVSYMSFVPLNDGTVGATWAEIGGSSGNRTGFVYWGTSPDPTTLSTVPGSVGAGAVLLISQTVQQHAGFRSTVQRGPDGDLYLILWVARHSTLVAGLLPLPPNEGTYVYRSADEGASWVLHGNVQVYGGGVGGGSFGGYGSLGEIYFSDSGRWILPYPRISNFFGATRGSVMIAYSDDLGVTWTSTTNHRPIEGSTRQIIYNTADGLLYFCSNRGLNNPDFQWRASADDGLTWPVFEDALALSGEPFVNQNWTGVTTATGMQWFSGMATRARVYNVDTALSVSATPQTDPVMIRNWEAFNADLNVTIEPIGGGLWIVADSNELLQVMEASEEECSAIVTVTCCEDLV